jgi:hypothetical protein
MEEGRERPALPPLHHLVGHQPLPGRPPRPEPLGHALGEQALEPATLPSHAVGQLPGGLAHLIELAVGLPHEPVGQLDRTGPPHPPRRPAHELGVDRRQELGEARLGLQPRRRAGRGLDTVDAEDPRHHEALSLELPPPVGPDIGVAGGVGLHEQERPTRREGRQLAGHDPGAILLHRRHK